jgi:hypothetical protein
MMSNSEQAEFDAEQELAEQAYAHMLIALRGRVPRRS